MRRRCSAQCDLIYLTPCAHEEADTRMFLYVSDAVKKGCKNVPIRATDTDAVPVVAKFRRIESEELWISFGKGISFRYTGVHELASKRNLSTCTML